MVKVCIIVLNVIMFYYKPVYIFFIWVLFCFEHVFFINYACLLWSKRFDYYSIKVDKIDDFRCSFIELWIEFCKVCAFSRLYSMLRRKKMSFINLFLCFILILLGIPFRLLRVSYFILKSDKNLRDAMVDLYYSVFLLNKDGKIEILNCEIYLNCFTLLMLLKKSNIRYGSKKLKLEYLDAIKNYYLKYNALDKKRSEMITFNYSKIVTEEGKGIDIPHPTLFLGNNSVHTTSKLPKLEMSQKSIGAIPSAIVHGAKSPGTIFSSNVRVSKVYAGIRFPAVEVKSALYKVTEEPISNCEYTYNKDMDLQEILFKFTGRSELETKNLRTELRNNCYCNIFLNSNNKDFLLAIMEDGMSHDVNE